MTEEDDIDGLAAEYVLGSLGAAERADVEARRQADAALDAAIEAWERRLGPLSERAPGVAPPPHILQGILARISAQASQSARTAEILPFRGGSSRRLTFATFAGALAACLALVVVWSTNPPPTGQQPGTDVTQISCGSRYKDFWERFDRDRYARISAEQLAGVSRMALRAYDACEAGDEQDATSLFERLRRMSF